MLKKILPEEYSKLYSLFNRNERFKIFLLFIMMLIASILEVAGISMIPLFISIVADPDMIMKYEPVGNLLALLGISDSSDLLVAGAIMLISIFVIKGVYMLFFYYVKTRFIYNRRYTLSTRLMNSYMRAPYTFHLGRNTSELLRNITSEVNIMINQVLNPSLELAKEVIMVISVLVFLIILEPLITLVVFVVLGGATGLFLFFTQKKVKEYGKREQAYRSAMIKAVSEGLGGLKEARVLNREYDFIQTFRETAFWSSRLQATTNFIKHIPKPVIEAIAVAGMMLVAVIMVWQGRPIVAIIPVLTLFGIATVRLMPAIKTMTSTITSLTYSLVSVNPVHDDLKLMDDYSRAFSEDRKKKERFRLTEQIELNDVSYSYPNSSEQALKNISLTIPRGKAVAFVGPSGAGKTTIVDLLLGLLEPDHGTILVDDKNIHSSISAWQKNIGYIPQFIYLADNTLRRNVAFGLPEHEIDEEKILKAVELAQLSELVRSLPEGMDTIIGEAGTRLSGGQRQRVGIARALYHEPEVLVMDEATSALDNITEKQITEAIESLKGERTVIMIAHRLTTVENCDVLFMMKNGQMTDMGRYDELVKNNHEFRRMALVE